MSALQKWPIISALMAAAFISTPLFFGASPNFSADRFETARSEVRAYWIAHPKLEVDPLGELMLEPGWLDEARTAAESSETHSDVKHSTRLMARAQNRFDGLVQSAYEERMMADPAWKFGVLDERSPKANFFAHAFFHESGAGILLGVLVLLFAGAPLERSWGKSVYLGFILVTLPVTASAFGWLDAQLGVPWSGCAGLSGALIGAYFIRGLGGHFVFPGWMMLGGWLVIESFVVRNLWSDDLGGMPWATLFAAVGFGACVSALLRLFGIESKLDRLKASRDSSAPNPIVSRAARLRSDGNPYQAFDLLKAAWREDPLDEELAECFFHCAVDVNRANAAAEAILPSLNQALRVEDLDRALEYWLPMVKDQTHVRLDAPAALRLAEELVERGHKEESLFTIRGMLEAGVSPAHALRVVSFVEDLDEGLAREAAIIALTDEHLGDERRAKLEDLIDSVPEPPPPTTWNQFDHDSLAGVDMNSNGSDTKKDDHEAQLEAQALDMGALTPSSLGEDLESMEAMEGSICAEDFGLGGEVGDPPPEEFEEELEESASDLFDTVQFRDFGEADSDFTPLMEPSADEAASSPFGDGGVVEETPDHAAESGAETDSALDASPPPASQLAEKPKRELKILMAVPFEATDRFLEIEVEKRGKSQLPLHRVQAISMAAIEGLGSRSVLLVDFVLNWDAALSEPLKVIRFRSDRFDPRRFEPAEIEPLHALSAWVRRLQVRSDAICLPDRQFLEGLFLHFETVEAYEAYVLMPNSTSEDSTGVS